MESSAQITQMETALTAQGWTKAEQNPFREKVSTRADAYFLLKNELNQELGLCVFSSNQLIKLRLFDPSEDDFVWFQVEYADKLPVFLDALIAEQHQADKNSYFGFYLALSATVPTSILAWEQWENNYR